MDKGRAAQLVDAGVWLRLSGDLEGARKLFERALKLDPENEKAREFLGTPAAAAPAADPAVPEVSPSGLLRQVLAEPLPFSTSPAPAAPAPLPLTAPVAPQAPAAPLSGPGPIGWPVASPVQAWRPAAQPQAPLAVPAWNAVPTPPPAPAAAAPVDVQPWSRVPTPPPIPAPVFDAPPPDAVLVPAEPRPPAPLPQDAGPLGYRPAQPLEALPEVTPWAAVPSPPSAPPAEAMAPPPPLAAPPAAAEGAAPQAAAAVPAVPEAPSLNAAPWSTVPSPVPVQQAAPAPEVLAPSAPIDAPAWAAVPSPPMVQPPPAAPPPPAVAPPSPMDASPWAAVPSPVPVAAVAAAPPPAVVAPPSPSDASKWAGEPSPVPRLAVVAAPVAPPTSPMDASPWASEPSPPPVPAVVAAQPAPQVSPMDASPWSSEPSPVPRRAPAASIPVSPAPQRKPSSAWSLGPNDGAPTPAWDLPPAEVPPTPGAHDLEPIDRGPNPTEWGSAAALVFGESPRDLLDSPPPPGAAPLAYEPKAGGEPPAPVPSPPAPFASPPMFSDSAFRAAAAAGPPPPVAGAPRNVVIGDARAPRESPPKPTPPMFEAEPIIAAAQTDLGTSGGGAEAHAWTRPSSPPPPAAAFAGGDAWGESFPPAPMPSPGIAPGANSAWDRKSDPGIKLSETAAVPVSFNLVEAPRISSVSSGTRRRADEVEALLRSARDLIGLDDHTGAVDLVNKALVLDPENEEVRQLKDRSERTLLTMLESKLGPHTAIPRVLLKEDEIIWLNLDHRAGFVLAQIDGTVSFEDLFAVSGMARLDTARILAQLIEQGVISRG